MALQHPDGGGFEFTRRLRSVSDRDARRMHESFVAPALAFDGDEMGDRLLFPLEMTWFYGEPVYESLGAAERIKLNRLTFCQSYLSTAVAEAATNVLNYEAALSALTYDDADAGEYMAREVVEETTHIQSFLIVIRKVLAHYGLTLEELRATNVSLPLATRYTQAHSVLGWVLGDLNFYYFTRFAMNVNQKTVERCTIDEPDMHPDVREILRHHAIDEARHMQMSRGTGKVALERMRARWMRNLACIGYARFAARLYIGRHRRDGSLQAGTRIRTLMLCGVEEPRAREAYRQWRDRVNQPDDPPLVQSARLYYVKQNFAYIDELDVSDSIRSYMKRAISATYGDVIRAEREGGLRPLELGELRR